VDRHGLEISDRDLEPGGQLFREVCEATDTAVGVMQDDQLAAGWADL
jgi:hypothetical protein